jgi:hypothetical protein
MALFLELAPEEHQKKVMRNLHNDIVYRQNTHVTTGFIGVKYLRNRKRPNGSTYPTGLGRRLERETDIPQCAFFPNSAGW